MTRVALVVLGTVASLVAPVAEAQFRFDLRDAGKLLETAKKVQRATSEPTEKEEIDIGRDLAATLLGAAPLLDDAELQRYVNRVGRWVASQTERPGLPWRFGILDAPQVNAFAAPGGVIFVTRGLLARVNSEAELAGVLAHEIVHVLRKHHLQAIRKNALAEIATDALTASLQDANSEARRKIVSFGKEMYARGLDKADEFEADRIGTVIAVRAGYDPYGLPTVLQAFQTINPQDSSVALMFKTHPSPGERLEAIEKALAALLDRYSLQPQVAERYVAAIARATNSRR